MYSFNMEWLGLCREKLKDNGSIWISGTYHNIFSVANLLGRRFLGIDQEVDYLEISRCRREDLKDSRIYSTYRSKIKDVQLMNSFSQLELNEVTDNEYGDLPF